MHDPTDVSRAVTQHYTRGNLAEGIFDALRQAGKRPDQLQPDDLAALDQFHIGGQAATLALAELAGIQEGWSVLDVGGGIGGPARTLAKAMRCQVTVLELTEEFVEVGALLSERMDLAGKVHFRHGSGTDMPFPDGKFDAVWTQHSTMNISHKDRLYQEAHRVLRKNGRLALHEVVTGHVQPVEYPTPWAESPATSFLLSATELRQLIRGSGFAELAWQDTTEQSLEWFGRIAAAAVVPGLSLQLVLTPEARRNALRNLQEQRVEIVQAAFRRP
jgi:SAM-dependent methyltransferase